MAEKGGDVRWLVSYSDFMMQLVCLFILLFIVSAVYKQDLSKISEAIKQKFGYKEAKRLPKITEKTKGENLSLTDEMFKQKKGFVKFEDVKGKQVKKERVEQGIKYSFGRNSLFEEGSYNLTRDGEELIWFVGNELKGTFYIIEVLGFTSTSAKDSVSGNHWLLALKRAESVIDFLCKEFKLNSNQFRIVSFGKNRNENSYDNRIPEERKYNQRVEIVVTDKLLPAAERQ